MRHGKKDNHLGRTSSHRKALLSNMASSLIVNKRITTTLAKAKELRKFVEPLLTKSKEDSTHSRRTVFSYLQNKESVKVLFDEISSKISSRPGGYTRIIKTGNRLGDNAETCIIELVDYNEIYTQEKGKAAGKKTRRSRRSGSKSEGVEAQAENRAEVVNKAAAKEEKAAKKAQSSVEEKPSKKSEGTEGEGTTEKE